MNVRNTRSCVVVVLTALFASTSCVGMSSREKVMTACNASALQALAYGFFTTQYSNLYFAPNVISGLMALKSGSAADELRQSLKDATAGQSTAGITLPMPSSTVINALVYSVGCGVRYFTTNHVMPKLLGIDQAPRFSRYPGWAQLCIDLGLSYLAALTLTDSRVVTRHIDAKKAIAEEAAFNQDEENYLAGLKSISHSRLMYGDPHPVKTVITRKQQGKDYKKLLAYLMDEVYADPNNILRSSNFHYAIEYSDSEILDLLIDKVFKAREDSQHKYYRSAALQTFVDVLTEHDFHSSEQKIYFWLKLFSRMQQLGHNLDPNNYRNSLLTLSLISGSLCDDLTKYLVEIGTTIYFDKKVAMDDEWWIKSPYDISSEYNLVMRKYIIMVDRYYKMLLLESEGYLQKGSLKSFIEKCSDEEKGAIFRIAACRGHLPTLKILSALDQEQFSMLAAAKLATEYRLDRTLRKLLFYSPKLDRSLLKVTSFDNHEKALVIRTQATIKSDLRDVLREIFPDASEGEIFALFDVMKDYFMRLNPKRFDHSVKLLRGEGGK